MNTNEQGLIERIQGYISGAKVISARRLEIVGEGDDAIFPFAYSTDAAAGEMRGAFTNADPIWEEADAEAFRTAIGEE